MVIRKRLFAAFLAGLLTVGSFSPVQNVNAQAVETKTTKDGLSQENSYDWQGKWIWTNDAREEGQWVSLRKSFDLNKVPEKVMAKIAVDSKYWLWINGEMAVFEGAVKTGPNREDMYYDNVDIGKYLKEGRNTIAVTAVYFGKNGYGFKDSGKAGFLFDADFGEGALKKGTRIVSDSTWRAIKDPAYLRPNENPNYRIAEPNIRYDASKELKGWKENGFDDTAWAKATVLANVGESPFNGLFERPIPQLKVYDVNKYTLDGANETGKWTVEDIGDGAEDTFTPLSLPDTYKVTCEFMCERNPINGTVPAMGSLGLTVNMQDANNFYMPQVSMADQGSSYDYATYKPHIRTNGNWSVPFQKDVSSVISGDKRFYTKHTLEVTVDADGVDSTLDGVEMERLNTSVLRNGSIGFRNDNFEKVRIYALEATSVDGKETYFKDTFQEDGVGKRLTQFKRLDGGNEIGIREDENGEHYLYTTDGIIQAGTVTKAENTTLRYTIRNKTNLQGTPYIKVRSKAGKEILMYTDAWHDINGDSVRHRYITKDGEQEFEALGWMNGYDVYFEMPSSVEVLELGYRVSTYNTEATGTFTSDNEKLNTLYQKSYDTLLVTMRDNYMDCPNRERAQWWGDAVNEMQMAFYSMDENAGLLYKKALNQVLGWRTKTGRLPTTAPNGIDEISELPMQALAGVMSFWQYYLYSGDVQPLEDGYDALKNYVELWNVSASGDVSHRSGSWDWMDWGSNPDGKIIETCWYYEALKSVKNIASVLNKTSDISFFEERMELIEENFDQKFWNEEKAAYYNSTANNKADDRANALAVYSGLAKESRYENIKTVLTTRFESSPYMEKYVLEALYMMGYDEEAMERTMNRYSEMIEDPYPTLWEFWVKADGTPNHAWSGGPLSMMYMFNAGITPITAGYKTFRVRPLTGGLKEVSAKITTPGGDISVSIDKKNAVQKLEVSVPQGSTEAEINVPKIDGKSTKIMLGERVLYTGGKAATLPEGISYVDEDKDFVNFRVGAGDYTFTSQEDTFADAQSYTVSIDKSGEGTVVIGDKNVTEYPYSTDIAKGSQISIKATPAEGYKLARIVGTVSKVCNATTETETAYTVNGNITYKAVFEKLPETKHKVTIHAADGKNYAAKLLVNGVEQFLPYERSFAKGTELSLKAVPVESRNYTVSGWSGGAIAEGDTLRLEVGDEDVDLEVNISEQVEKTPIVQIDASNAIGGSWAVANLADGNRVAVQGADGYSTEVHKKDLSDLDTPLVIIADLGEVKTFNQVAIFPRSNAAADGNHRSCNFPENFTISVSSNGKNYKEVRNLENYPNPRFLQQTFSFANQQARYVKIIVTRLGEVAADENSASNYRLQLSEVEVYNNANVNLPSKDALVEAVNAAKEYRTMSLYKVLDDAEKQTFENVFASAKNVLDDAEANADAVEGAQNAIVDANEHLVQTFVSTAASKVEQLEAAKAAAENSYNQALLDKIQADEELEEANRQLEVAKTELEEAKQQSEEAKAKAELAKKEAEAAIAKQHEAEAKAQLDLAKANKNASAEAALVKGAEFVSGNLIYKVLNQAKLTVSVTGMINDSKNVVIPATVKVGTKKLSVTEVESGAFEDYDTITSVVLGTNIKKIGAKSFLACTKLKKVTIKSTRITSFGKNAFGKIHKKAKFKLPKKKVSAYKKKNQKGWL
ncbi:MAG: discoidin domain-containing protein [Lachnospiraceae bacterium]|nr:discoidin domain-containing protein [Lachnospiraceae bacterium]